MARKLPSADKQADRAITPLLATNQPRHQRKQDGQVHSIGTARQYRSIYKGVATWLAEKHNERLSFITPELAHEYLQERSGDIQQKQLNNERRALEIHLRHLPRVRSTTWSADVTLTRVTSEVATIERSRAYTAAQVELLQSLQSDRLSLSTQLASAAGLRAEELLTLRRFEERLPSSHRAWSKKRFTGREDWHRYTVQGKGGLIREVRFPPELSARLEAKRLSEPERVTDRNVHHDRVYDVIGGKNFSNRYSVDSRQHLGWSEGAHGLRHTYAQLRMEELQNNLQPYSEALAIVSQEMGHFRPDITEVYLR